MNDVFMKRALSLAKRGMGKTLPNPMVGAVLVKQDKIIGEGWHKKYGLPHAEINAIKSAKQDIKNSTLYVTLEPCSHYGKTPPCTEAIIKSKIKKVVIASLDPNPIAKGGAEVLRKNGVEVITGVLEKEALRLNEVFFKNILSKKPFVVLKSAATLDGKTVTKNGDSKWITNTKAREYAHNQLRFNSDAIIVGRKTLDNDNPNLTVRVKKKLKKTPIRIVLDTNLNMNLKDKNIFNKKAETIVVVSDKIEKSVKQKTIENLGAKILKTPLKGKFIDISALMTKLYSMGIFSVLVEGGSSLISSFIKAKEADKFCIFYAPKILGENGVSLFNLKEANYIKDVIMLKDISFKKFDDNFMVEGYF